MQNVKLLLVCSIVFSVAIHFASRKGKEEPIARIHHAEKKLIDLRQKGIETLKKISSLSGSKELSSFFIRISDEQRDISYYLFRNGALEYWSDNEPSVNETQLASVKDGQLITIPNGDYLTIVLNVNSNKYIGLILIRHSYEFENKYLVNNFNPILGLNDFVLSDSGASLSLPGSRTALLVKHDPYSIVKTSGWITGAWFFICFLLCLAIYLLLHHYQQSRINRFVILFSVIAARILMIYFKMPVDLYTSDVFSPSYYASSFFFNSLGDMLLNSMLFLVFAITYYNQLNRGRTGKWLPALIFVATGMCAHVLIKGLVYNSNISFELSSTDNVNLYSILAFTSIAILLLCLLFIAATLLKRIVPFELNARNSLLGITFCSIYAAIALGMLNEGKELEMRKQLALKVEMRQDQVAEYLFSEEVKRIQRDTLILSGSLSGKFANDALVSYLGQRYFSGYLSKFEITAELYDEMAKPDPQLINYRLLSQESKATQSDLLFYLDKNTGGASYLALIPLKGDSLATTLVLLLNTRFLQSAKGFPELLLSGRGENPPSDEYSFGRYSGQGLVYEYGSFIYPLSGKIFPKAETDFHFVNYSGYSHLIHPVEDDSFIVVSRKENTFFNFLTLFSWMFSFMTVLALVLFIFSLVFGLGKEWNWNLTRRVQASVILLVVFTLFMVGFGTIRYINTKYRNDQRKSISDQVNALWFLVNDNLGARLDDGNIDIESKKEMLDGLSANTNIDFNLYNSEGKLKFTSQPKITDKGIVSDRMNPSALLTIREEGLTQFIHPENTGWLNYVSAYAPLTDSQGNIEAYLNVPYFEKQNELNKEVSVFLSALVNIYVLLFAITVFVTIFISSLITKPLLLLQEKLSGIRLGFANEKISYSEKDEIGQLVTEYNRMIDELAVSAEKLARSERETAWREMARQVAHEIKNPLTPMKLSVQHLFRAFKEKAQDEAMIERITNTLIQQIDTLSNIATAFSNFANMPQPVPVEIDLNLLLGQMAELYKEESSIHLHQESKGTITADKDQLIGIFSNLLKNAVQSVPSGREGRIDIFVRQGNDCIVVEIRDNGIGIPEDQRDKIFTPNFTTKSSGMGLGLAIVRNIVEGINGKIWFTSTYNEGSSFFVSLPVQT